MKAGDLVKRTVPLAGLDKIYGIVIEAWTSDDGACEVLWPDGSISMPFKKNLAVVS
jgi:hypothetical protein